MARLSQLSDHAALLARVRVLHAEGRKAPAIAAALNAEGWTPPKRRVTYNASMAHDLLKRLGVPSAAPRLSLVARLQDRAPGELTIDELAAKLDMPRITVHSWASRGLVKARKVLFPNHPHGLWLIQTDDTEIECLRERRRNACTSSPPKEA